MIKRDEKWDSLLQGNYAPFGYVVEGFDTMTNLKSGDIVKNFKVDEFGMGNLKLPRRKGFGFGDEGEVDVEEEMDVNV